MNPRDFIEFFKKLRSGGLEAFGLYYGKYHGEVVDNVDPTAKGRLKVKVPAVSNDPIESWAMPSGNPAGVQSGLFDIPDPGDAVWVSFVAGRSRSPIWEGGWWGKRGGQSEVPFSARRTPPNVKAWKMKNGARLEFDTLENSITVVNADGSFLVFRPVDGISERSMSNRRSEIQGGDFKAVGGPKSTIVAGPETRQNMGPVAEVAGASKSSVTVGNHMEIKHGNEVDAVAGNKEQMVVANEVNATLGSRTDIVGAGFQITSFGPMTLASVGPLTINSATVVNINPL